MNNLKKCILLSVLILSLPISGCASTDTDKKGRRPKNPPPEAIEACKGKVEGDQVSFTGRRGETLKAECKLIEDILVAVPEGMDERGGRPPRN